MPEIIEPEQRVFGRRIHFDERSRAFPIRAMLEDRPPRSYTWNFYPDKRSGPMNQGNDGSCVGFAWTHESCIRPLASPRNAKFAKETVYWEAQKIDVWPGGSYPNANPWYEGTSVLAGAKVMHKMGYFREYRWAFGLNDLVQAVGYHGPAVIGVNWRRDMFNPDQWGFIKPTGPVMGGHALVCAGVNMSDKFFTLINSWGTQWGVPRPGLLPGWCRIRFRDMETLLADQGEACIPSVRRSKDILPQP